jgi:hypothetical protein
VICLGSNSHGQLGQGLGTTEHQGDAAPETSSVEPVPFNNALVPFASTALGLLHLSTHGVISLVTCQTIYPLYASSDASTAVTVVSATASTAGATIKVNDGPLQTSVPLRMYAVNMLKITVTVGRDVADYRFFIRKIPPVSVHIGASSSTKVCIWDPFDTLCWGVRFISSS